jgi:O-acetylhomoserine (thiol)-lyase
MTTNEAARGFTTAILHADRDATVEHGALHKPLHVSVAYGYRSARALADVFQGREPGYVYGRQGNPTTGALEAKVTAMEEGVATVSFATGMAAIGAVLLALLRAGDHVIASRYLFGNTANLLGTLEAHGHDITLVDATDANEVESAIRPATRLVFVETIANPRTQVADLAGIGRVCAARGIVYVVDNTMTSPWLFKPKSVGASLVVNALTKYIGGHGNALGGSVTDTGLFDWTRYPNIDDAYKGLRPAVWGMQQIRKKGLRDWGGTLSAEQAHHIAAGSETLALRMDRQCANATALARFLAAHPKVAAVHYPGLEDHAQHARTRALFRRPGALLAFEPDASLDVFALLDRLRVVVLSSNLGDNRTLAIPVAQTIFWEMGRERREAMGIAESLVRVSVGIEDEADLIADFAQALDGATASG